MSGIAPKLPLQTSPIDGYALTKTLKETMKQKSQDAGFDSTRRKNDESRVRRRVEKLFV
jgi:hypothetical protein